MDRVPTVEKTKDRICDLFNGKIDNADLKGYLVRLAVRQIVEEALEAVTWDLLGRYHYKRCGEGVWGTGTVTGRAG